VRVATTLAVRWDAVRLGVVDEGTRVVTTRLPLVSARLFRRGFSAPVPAPPGRAPAETYDYERLDASKALDPLPLLATPLGDVTGLLVEEDLRTVALAAGDALALAFDARALPAPGPGTVRDWFVRVAGWTLDGDGNGAAGTASPAPAFLDRFPTGLPRAPEPWLETLAPRAGR
jgi:hypothetical protein